MSEINVQEIRLDAIQPSRWNRQVEVDAELESLAQSIRQKGVLQPIILRSLNGKAKDGIAYEIVAGERRWRASRLAEREGIPAIIREGLTDQEAFEITLIENLQRRDLTPLEEAEGYQQLLRMPGASVAQVAARIGRSVQFVYDRAKLLNLVDQAQQLLRSGEITAGHAVILARLRPDDQKRAMGEGLFEHERVLFTPQEEKRNDERADELVRKGESDELDSGVSPWSRKAVTVRELQSWIDKNVRFEAEPDPMLFPETTETLAYAREEELKVVSITHEYHVLPEAKDGTRIYGPRSWRSADGNHDGKPCEHSVVGVVVIGAERGAAFRVCIAKKKCKIHWAEELRDAAKTAKARATSGSSGADRWKEEERKRAEERAKEDAKRNRFKKAKRAVLEAIATKIGTSNATAKGPLAGLIVDQLKGYLGSNEAAAKVVPMGKTADELVRHLAFFVIYRFAQNEYAAFQDVPKLAKAIGVDVEKIIEAENPDSAPAAKPTAAAKRAPAKKKAKK